METYYLSWFIIYSFIAVISSLVVTFMSIYALSKTDPRIMFLFSFLYSLSFFGQSFICVAFMPNQKSSGLIIVLTQFLIYFLSSILADPGSGKIIQYCLSVVPNVCMVQMMKQVFFFNNQTDVGLTFKTMSF